MVTNQLYRTTCTYCIKYKSFLHNRAGDLVLSVIVVFKPDHAAGDSSSVSFKGPSCSSLKCRAAVKCKGEEKIRSCDSLEYVFKLLTKCIGTSCVQNLRSSVCRFGSSFPLSLLKLFMPPPTFYYSWIVYPQYTNSQNQRYREGNYICVYKIA